MSTISWRQVNENKHVAKTDAHAIVIQKMGYAFEWTITPIGGSFKIVGKQRHVDLDRSKKDCEKHYEDLIDGTFCS